MDSRTWAYGPNGEAEIFATPEDIPAGWSDSPASAKDKPSGATDVFLASLTDMPEKEAKLALDQWAEEEHGIRLNRRYTLTNMLKQLEESLDGDGD